jgi:oligopeptidase A
MANPLAETTDRIPFGAIEPEHVVPAIDAHLEAARAALDAIGAVDGPRTWTNTADALERATQGLEWAMGVVGHLESVATTDALREAYAAVQPRVAQFTAAIAHDARLYAALEDLATSPEGRALTGIRRRWLDKTRAEFRRAGAALGAAEKARLQAISAELAEITQRFSEHVLDATNAFEIVVTDPRRLAGLPESAIAAAHADARDKGQEGWRFTLQEPSLVAVLTYLDDAEIRERVWRAFNTRATSGDGDNRPLVRRILDLRRERARLLGYADFADLVLEDRMARTGSAAAAFVADLDARARPAFEEERAALLAFRRELEGGCAPEFAAWDVGLWAERQRRARFDFDDEALRPYFPVESVLSGLFELVGRLYGVKIERRDDLETWHPDVRTWRIVDGDGAELGSFFADLHPREDKRGGAWMNSLVTGGPDPRGGPRRPHVGLICANLSKPLDGRPALLTHREVETIFHEFGHLLHHMFSDVEIRSLAGTNVAWDFVELPSQIMENFCWKRAALDLFARHVDTGEAIPPALFEKMERARTYRGASATMRQLGFASLDLGLHRDLPAGADPIAFAREVAERFAAAPIPEDYAMVCGFLHLFAHPVAYAAGYYSYKWAEVLDADAFTAFEEAGIFDASVGRRFRATILSRGDADEPGALFEAFMGRAPRIEPLLRRSGLLGRSAA